MAEEEKRKLAKHVTSTLYWPKLVIWPFLSSSEHGCLLLSHGRAKASLMAKPELSELGREVQSFLREWQLLP